MTVRTLFGWGLLLALVLPAGFLAMAPALEGGFLNWDDDVYVTGNPLVTGSPAGFGSLFTTLHAGHYFPLTLLSYRADFLCAGLSPRRFHLTNILLHLAATALVFLVANLLGTSAPAALAVALLFAIHPAHAESVAWIAERKDTLYAPLFLGSLAAWLARDRTALLYPLSILLFAAALMAKSMAMTLPLILILVDHYRERPMTRASLAEKTPYLLLAAASATVTLLARKYYLVELRQPPYTIADLPGSLYRILFVHLGEILLPFGIFPLHPRGAAILPLGIAPGLLEAAAVLLVAVAVPAILVAGWRRRSWAFGPLFFLVTILPVVAITAPGYFADRYTYLPSIGIFLLVAPSLVELIRSPSLLPVWRGLLALAMVSALAFLPLKTRARAAAWGDGVALWSRAIQLYPGIPDAWYLRGELLAARGEHRAAVSDFDAAQRRNYAAGALYEARAFSLIALGEDAAALRDLDTLLAVWPDRVEAQRARDRLRTRIGSGEVDR